MIVISAGRRSTYARCINRGSLERLPVIRKRLVLDKSSCPSQFAASGSSFNAQCSVGSDNSISPCRLWPLCFEFSLLHSIHYWKEKLLVLTVLKIWLYHDEGGVWSGLEPCGRSSLWQLFFSQRQHTHVQQQLWYGNTYGTQYHTVPQATLCNTDSHTPWPSNALSTAG